MKKIKDFVNRLLSDIKEYGWAGIVFLCYYLLVHSLNRPFCPMLHLTGIPCAGCGLTRAFLYLFSGQPGRAFYIHPMAFVIAAFLLYCGYFRYIRGTRIKGFTVAFVLLIAAMLVFYAIRMYRFFPDRVPYVYTSDNILARRVPGYDELVRSLIQKLRAMRL